MSWQRIELSTPLEAGQKTLIVLDERELLVCRVRDDYYAVANRCTHAAWPLAGEPLEGFELVCTLHGARFDVRDGCPTAGPASRALDHYPIELREDGLYVSV